MHNRIWYNHNYISKFKRRGTAGLKIIGKYGDIPFQLSEDDIDRYIKTSCYSYNIQLKEYLLDENGNVCGIKALADEGHGYGFNFGFKEFIFILKIGETYSFNHSYTSIKDSTDWSNDEYKVTLQLIEAEE